MNQAAVMTFPRPSQDGDRLQKRIQQIVEQRTAAHTRVDAEFFSRLKAALDEATPPNEAPPTAVPS